MSRQSAPYEGTKEQKFASRQENIQEGVIFGG